MLGELAERTRDAPCAPIAGTLSAYPERTFGGYYLDIDVDREAAARYGLTTGDVQDVIQTAIGGMNVTTTVEGLERYPLNVRYARELRDDLPALRAGAGADADRRADPARPARRRSRINPGPADDPQRERAAHGVDLRRHRRPRPRRLRRRGASASSREQVPLPPATRASGRASSSTSSRRTARLAVVIPITLVLIVLLLYVANQSWFRVGVVLLAVPFSLIGAFWFLWALDYNMSLAVWVGIIALLGVDAETGQVMLLYLDTTFDRFARRGPHARRATTCSPRSTRAP